jgi:hypothetical protein
MNLVFGDTQFVCPKLQKSRGHLILSVPISITVKAKVAPPKLIDWLNPHQHTVSFIGKQIDITVRALAYVADTS